MFTVCDECHQNYDDSSHLAECNGPGMSGNHRQFQPRPIDTHMASVKATAHRVGKGATKASGTGLRSV